MDANSTVDNPVPSAGTVQTVLVRNVMPNENSFWVYNRWQAEPTLTEQADTQKQQRDNGLRYVSQWRNAVDIGAHVGEWTRSLSRKFDHVICFEPNPNFRECFNRNIKENNVTLHPYGLSSHSHNATQGVNATHLNDVLGDTEPNDGDIECRTLDSFNLTDVDYVKIDVDGFEIPLLEGARNTLKTNSPTVNIEMKRRKRPLIVHKAKEILTGLGYTYQSRVNSDEIWTKS